MLTQSQIKKEFKMAVYAIGDIQGCYDQLQHLLDTVNFDPNKDKLWIAGDLVNRGPQSLLTLRFIKSLKDRAVVVLGNHDLSLLAISENYGSIKNHTVGDILNAADREELLFWLRQQKLMHYSKKRGFVMVHAGIYPTWSLNEALTYAKEVEQILRSPNYRYFLSHLFGNHPLQWDPQLKNWQRLRFITNTMTRMRYCTENGELDFKHKGPVGTQGKKFKPWFDIEHRKTKEDKIIFGHWSSLSEQHRSENIFPLDTGCLWGGKLTAMRLPKKRDKNLVSSTAKLFQINCG